MINGIPAFLFILIWVVGIISGILLFVGAIGVVVTFPILLFRLRKKKEYLILKLDSYNPKRMQGWTGFLGLSWISYSQSIYRWISYPIDRWVNKMTKEERKICKDGIKKELGKDFRLYWINVQLQNLGTLGTILTVSVVLFAKYINMIP